MCIQDIPGKELTDLIEQIHSHVKCLKTNIEQVGGICEKITQSKANLQATLFNNIGRKEYEYIVTGIEL